MHAGQQLSAVAIDLTRLHPRTVTSFYSNLVTRPTGRAVRLGVEQQLADLGGTRGPCLSILDFSQVRIMDYSCADEIVAKLLLRYAEMDPPAPVYFLARGLHEHHIEAVEAVLDRHSLLLAAEGPGGELKLFGPCSPEEATCWEILVRRGRCTMVEFSALCGLASGTIEATVARLLRARVALALPGDILCPVNQLNHA
jgi:hypothetical protein